MWDLQTLWAVNQKLQIQPAERKEFVCSTAKGSICCVSAVRGLLPSLIKYSRVVHPKSAALLTHHPSLAADKVDEAQLRSRALVSAPPSRGAAGKAAPGDSPHRSASPPSLSYLHIFWPWSVLAEVDGHVKKLWDWCSPLSFTACEWDERLGFFLL